MASEFESANNQFVGPQLPSYEYRNGMLASVDCEKYYVEGKERNEENKRPKVKVMNRHGSEVFESIDVEDGESSEIDDEIKDEGSDLEEFYESGEEDDENKNHESGYANDDEDKSNEMVFPWHVPPLPEHTPLGLSSNLDGISEAETSASVADLYAFLCDDPSNGNNADSSAQDGFNIETATIGDLQIGVGLNSEKDVDETPDVQEDENFSDEDIHDPEENGRMGDDEQPAVGVVEGGKKSDEDSENVDNNCMKEQAPVVGRDSNEEDLPLVIDEGRIHSVNGGKEKDNDEKQPAQVDDTKNSDEGGKEKAKDEKQPAPVVDDGEVNSEQETDNAGKADEKSSGKERQIVVGLSAKPDAAEDREAGKCGKNRTKIKRSGRNANKSRIIQDPLRIEKYTRRIEESTPPENVDDEEEHGGTSSVASSELDEDREGDFSDFSARVRDNDDGSADLNDDETSSASQGKSLRTTEDDEELLVRIQGTLESCADSARIEPEVKAEVVRRLEEIQQRLDFGPGLPRTSGSKMTGAASRHRSVSRSVEWVDSDPESVQRFGYILYHEMIDVINQSNELEDAEVDYAGPKRSWKSGVYRKDGRITPLPNLNAEMRKKPIYAGNKSSGNDISFKTNIGGMMVDVMHVYDGFFVRIDDHDDFFKELSKFIDSYWTFINDNSLKNERAYYDDRQIYCFRIRNMFWAGDSFRSYVDPYGSRKPKGTWHAKHQRAAFTYVGKIWNLIMKNKNIKDMMWDDLRPGLKRKAAKKGKQKEEKLPPCVIPNSYGAQELKYFDIRARRLKENYVKCVASAYGIPLSWLNSTWKKVEMKNHEKISRAPKTFDMPVARWKPQYVDEDDGVVVVDSASTPTFKRRKRRGRPSGKRDEAENESPRKKRSRTNIRRSESTSTSGLDDKSTSGDCSTSRTPVQTGMTANDVQDIVSNKLCGLRSTLLNQMTQELMHMKQAKKRKKEKKKIKRLQKKQNILTESVGGGQNDE